MKQDRIFSYAERNNNSEGVDGNEQCSSNVKEAPNQNRRQKVFNRVFFGFYGWFSDFAGRLDILKIHKTPLIYCVRWFNLGGLELCLGGLNPPNPPVATGLHLIRSGPNVIQLPKLENGMAHISDTGSFCRIAKF